MSHSHETTTKEALALLEELTLTRTVHEVGVTEYTNSRGELHRTHGPALILPDGSQAWWLNGLPHREDGPAVTRSNGTSEWWVNGEWRPDLEEEAERPGS